MKICMTGCLLEYSYFKDVIKWLLFIIEEAKETGLDFSQETVNVLWIQFYRVQLRWIIRFLSV